MEEVGLTTHSLAPLFIDNHMHVKEGFFAGHNVFGICYVCKDWTGDVTLSPEHVKYLWVTPQEFIDFDFGADNGFFATAMQSYIDSQKP